MSAKRSQDNKPHTSYADMREATRDLLRQNLVDAADYLITKEGPSALTVRRIAEELDASTKVIYSLFGGKDGVANELYLEGCARLREAMESVPKQEVVSHYLRKSAWAYWDFARANPSYYRVMFANAIPNFKPKPENMQAVVAAFAAFEQTLFAYHAEDKLPTENMVETIHFIWATLHGVISLYLAQHFTEEEARARYEIAIDAIIGHLHPV